MQTDTAEPRVAAAHFVLHFESLLSQGRGLAFPCDALGQVDIDRMSMPGRPKGEFRSAQHEGTLMSTPARTNYLYARAVIGREYRFPAVRIA